MNTMLGITPLAGQGYNYYAQNVVSTQGPHQHYGAVPQQAYSAFNSEPVLYRCNANSNYAYQQPLVAHLPQQPKLTSYGYSSACSSRSGSISVSPAMNKGQVRLPPISALVAPTVYAQEQHQQPLSPPAAAFQVSAALPQPMVMIGDSSNASLLSHPHPHPHCQQSPCQQSHCQHSYFQHSHSHSHSQPQPQPQPTTTPHLASVRYNHTTADQRIEQTLSHNYQEDLSQTQQTTLNINPHINHEKDIDNNNRADILESAVRYRKQCPVCGKICSRPSTLKTHLLIHTGDTPFKCPWENCSKSFNVKSNMLRHLKSHERKEAKKKEGKKSSE